MIDVLHNHDYKRTSLTSFTAETVKNRTEVPKRTPYYYSLYFNVDTIYIQFIFFIELFVGIVVTAM